MTLATLTAGRIMVRPVTTVTPDTSVRDAREVLRRRHVRHLPVLDDGLLVGIVSTRDLVDAADSSPVAKHMSRPVFVLAPETPLHEAARLLRERRVGALPVLEGRHLVGIVSVVDVVGALEAASRAGSPGPGAAAEPGGVG
jgi:acetoin utilization protein AcuB